MHCVLILLVSTQLNTSYIFKRVINFVHMKDKIIFWLDADLTHFGLAKYLQEHYDCDMYAIIDITNKPKKFFKTQQLVKFQKIWFYHDYIQKSNDLPDMAYLAEFEEKYKINLWLIAHNERIFYNYNEFYKFSTNEVLKILEQECKLFETVLDETNPDFLIMRAGDLQQTQIFYELCKAKGIKLLLLGQTRFAYRYIISPYWHDIDPIRNLSESTKQNKTFDELLNYWKGIDLFKNQSDVIAEFRGSKMSRVKAIYKFLTSDNQNVKTHYTYYGRTKLRVLIKMTILLTRGKIREFYINRNLIREIKEKVPFFFFPLHVDQESTLLLGAPFHTNQLEIITNIAKSLPVGYQLYVKEHPVMKMRGWRSISYYKQLMNLPNVKVLHPSINPDEIMKKCSLVLAITSTAGLEAAFHQKCSIIFADAPYSILSSVYRIRDVEELPKVIRSIIKKDVDIKDLNRYVNFVSDNSFKFNNHKIERGYSQYFYYNGNLTDVEITEEQMKSFLENHDLEFKQLALEHVKQIQHYKKD